MATEKPIFYLTVFLIAVGIVFSYSLSTYVTALFGKSEFFFFIRQGVVGFVGIFIVWFISRLNPDKYFVPLGFFIFGLFLFLMTMMPFLPNDIVTEVGGAKRWIKLPMFSISPVEFFKVGFIFFLAWSFSRKIDHHAGKDLIEEFEMFLPYIAAFGLVVYLIAIMQNDLGQVIVLGSSLVVMAFIAGTSTRFFILAMLLSIVVFVVAIMTSDHRILRIKLWWSSIQNFVLSFLPDSLADALRVQDSIEPYQISNSFYAIINGGLFGEGLGNGTIKLGFLTEVHTDFVLAGIAEELGAVGLLFIVFVFFALIFRIFRIANRLENKMEYLFVLGIGLMITSEFFLNALGVTGITPIKGIAVPFVSYGGSSLLAHSFAIGMVLMISKKVKNI